MDVVLIVALGVYIIEHGVRIALRIHHYVWGYRMSQEYGDRARRTSDHLDKQLGIPAAVRK